MRENIVGTSWLWVSYRSCVGNIEFLRGRGARIIENIVAAAIGVEPGQDMEWVEMSPCSEFYISKREVVF